MNYASFVVPAGSKIQLKDYDPASTGEFRDRSEAQKKLEEDIARLAGLQDVLYAQDRYALLIIFQGIDTAGKDGAIKHVMSGVNPQGVQVFAFKTPSAEERDHDFLWRHMKDLPERGRIGIFNRSYYEEVLVARVHPELLQAEQIPPEARTKDIWKHRYEDINNVERYLVRNGILVMKFFLHLSKKEQKRRLLDRIDTPGKNWKYSSTDVEERRYWSDYMRAYEDMLNHTSTAWAPWYIVPADHKWFTRTVIADLIISKLKSLRLSYPTVSKEHKAELKKAKQMLERESR